MENSQELNLNSEESQNLGDNPPVEIDEMEENERNMMMIILNS